MGHDRNSYSSGPKCGECDAEMVAILGRPISSLGIYREVVGYRCPDEADHAPETGENRG